MLRRINGKFTMGKFKSILSSYSFALNQFSLSILRFRSRYVADLAVAMVFFFYFKLNVIDAHSNTP